MMREKGEAKCVKQKRIMSKVGQPLGGMNRYEAYTRTLCEDVRKRGAVGGDADMRSGRK